MDLFLLINIQKHVDDTWGREILVDAQKTRSVSIDKKNILDDHAFQVILRHGEIQEWQKVLSRSEDGLRVCNRDYNLIFRLGTATERKCKHRLVYWDWQSKTRSQWYIEELQDDEWITIREHWQFMHFLSSLEQSYPYLTLSASIDDDDDLDWDFDDGEHHPEFELDDGSIVRGTDAGGEYFEYEFDVALNEYGLLLLDDIGILQKVGMLEVDMSATDFISIAPWHKRDL